MGRRLDDVCAGRGLVVLLVRPVDLQMKHAHHFMFPPQQPGQRMVKGKCCHCPKTCTVPATIDEGQLIRGWRPRGSRTKWETILVIPKKVGE